MVETSGLPEYPIKRYPTIAACGLDCGLCPRYYTAGPSRCPGCAGPDFPNKHPSCSFITCCVKRQGLEACGECAEYPCAKFKSDEDYEQAPESSSYPSYRKLVSNQRFIREHGIEAFITQQARRMALLKTMLDGFDDGRSKSYYCRLAGTADIDALERAIAEAARKIAGAGITGEDKKARAKTLRSVFAELPERQ